MTLTELVQAHFDKLEGWPRSRVTRIFVRFDDGATVEIETEPGATLVTRPVTFAKPDPDSGGSSRGDA